MIYKWIPSFCSAKQDHLKYSNASANYLLSDPWIYFPMLCRDFLRWDPLLLALIVELLDWDLVTKLVSSGVVTISSNFAARSEDCWWRCIRDLFSTSGSWQQAELQVLGEHWWTASEAIILQQVSLYKVPFATAQSWNATWARRMFSLSGFPADNFE